MKISSEKVLKVILYFSLFTAFISLLYILFGNYAAVLTKINPNYPRWMNYFFIVSAILQIIGLVLLIKKELLGLYILIGITILTLLLNQVFTLNRIPFVVNFIGQGIKYYIFYLLMRPNWKQYKKVQKGGLL